MGRLLKKDYTFADGTTIPKGVVLSANAYARHRDEALYEDAQTFKGFRYVPLEGSGEKQPLAVTPTVNYLGFGCGKGAW